MPIMKKDHLAVDIGTGFIKVIDPVTGTYGVLESPYILQSSILKPIEDYIVRSLKLLLSKMETNLTKADAALPSFASFLSPDEHKEIYKNIFKKAGLELTALHSEGKALASILGYTDNKPVLIIDLGDHATNFFVVRNCELERLSQTDFSVSSFSQLSTERDRVWDVIVKEAKSMSEGVSALYVTGGGAAIEGVPQYLANRLRVPLHTFSEEDPSFSVALGLLTL